MKLTIDFETRSEVALKNCGAHIYSKHPSTEIFCLAIKKDYEAARILVHPKFLDIMGSLANELPIISKKEVQKLLAQADIVEAHNVDFEKAIYQNILVARYKWPNININWKCSAAKSARFGLPRALEGACAARKVSVQKDMEGRRVMLKMCKPRKPTKNNPDIWHEDPQDLLKLCQYCITDVESEFQLSNKVPALSDKETAIWEVHNTINDRGFFVNVPAAKKAINFLEQNTEHILKKTEQLTKGAVNSPRQRDATLLWLAEHGVKLPDLTKDTVSKTLSNPKIKKKARKLLQYRQSLSKSSTAKLYRLIQGADADSRLRGTLLYYGASTGRWAGRRFQPHNMTRKGVDHTNLLFDLLESGDYDSFKLFFGDVNATLSKAIRSFIQAKPGYELLCADYSSIEGRVLAWVADEQYVLDNYRKGKDAYCVFASQIYGVKYGQIKKGYESGDKRFVDMRFEGKTGELACGYQGGEAAVARFAPNMGEKRRQRIVDVWRTNRPKTVRFWHSIERKAKQAIMYPGKVFTCSKIKLKVKNNALFCLLPSGRSLVYHNPRLKNIMTPWGEPKKAIIFKSVGIGSGWVEQGTYGGRLTENIVQAIARDVLAEALLRVERVGYPIVLHVHDEIICEMPKGVGSVKKLCALMCNGADWLKGCPISAEGFRTVRYKKG